MACANTRRLGPFSKATGKECWVNNGLSLVFRFLAVEAGNKAPIRGRTSTLALETPVRSGCIAHIRNLRISTRFARDVDLHHSIWRLSARSTYRHCFVAPELHWNPSPQSVELPVLLR